MKKITLLLLFTITTTVFSQDKKAVVEKINNLYVFTYSKPVDKYKTLGTLNKGLRNDSYKEFVTKSIDRVKKIYPTANAIIISIQKDGVDKGAPLIEAIELLE